MNLRSTLILMTLATAGAGAFAASTADRNQVTCRSDRSELTITPRGDRRYDVRLKAIAKSNNEYSLEALRRRMPGMPEEMLQKLAAAMDADQAGANEPTECRTVSSCIFSDIGASNLVTCAASVDGVEGARLSLDLVNGHYQMTCTTVSHFSEGVPVDAQNFRRRSTTYETSFTPDSCSY